MAALSGMLLCGSKDQVPEAGATSTVAFDESEMFLNSQLLKRCNSTGGAHDGNVSQVVRAMERRSQVLPYRCRFMAACRMTMK